MAETDLKQAEDEVDTRLMLRVKAGDRAAFRELYDRHAKGVVNFANRFVQDRARAEELAQDVFVKLHASAGRWEPKAKFKTFLFRIAANHCLNERRRPEYRAPKPKETDEENPGKAEQAADTEGPDAAVSGRQLEGAIAAALMALNERERAALSMARFEGMAYRDIAEALDTSEAAVKSLVHRATVAVAKALTPVVGHDPLAAVRGKERKGTL